MSLIGAARPSGLGRFDDLRLEKVGVRLHEALVERPGCSIRSLARGKRARQMQFQRFLHNDAVTTAEMARTAAAHTSRLVRGRHVLAIQDSSELVYGGKEARARGFGVIGRGGALGGLLLHMVLAVDADTGGLLGLIDMPVINRDQGPVEPRRRRALSDKESRLWIESMKLSSVVLDGAASITVVGDRSGDIYEEFSERPANVHVLVRACQNRRIENTANSGATKDGKTGKKSATRLFEFADALPVKARFTTTIPAAPGREKRKTRLSVRYSPVVICKPGNGVRGNLPETVALTIVDIREEKPPAEGEPIHWRLLTSQTVENSGKARMILEQYRHRWIIEEYFHTLKTGGFDIEASQIESPAAMTRFIGASAVAAVTVLQLIRARDGNTDQPLEEAFEPEDEPLLKQISTRLEGSTKRQKNPHPEGSMAYASWVIARLGDWDGYYGKPGPKVMRRGLRAFYLIRYGTEIGDSTEPITRQKDV